jgi:hypothetical protein
MTNRGGVDDESFVPKRRGWRALLGLLWLNGLRFWLLVTALAVFMLVDGNALARAIGAVLLVASALGMRAMFRR